MHKIIVVIDTKSQFDGLTSYFSDYMQFLLDAPSFPDLKI